MIYKGFGTTVHYSEADNNYYGLLIADNGVMLPYLVMWESDDLDDVEEKFREAVDYYLEWKEEIRKRNKKDEVENV